MIGSLYSHVGDGIGFVVHIARNNLLYDLDLKVVIVSWDIQYGRDWVVVSE